MKYDPILREVHKMKQELVDDVKHDFHILSKRLHETEKKYQNRLAAPKPKVHGKQIGKKRR